MCIILCMDLRMFGNLHMLIEYHPQSITRICGRKCFDFCAPDYQIYPCHLTQFIIKLHAISYNSKIY